MQNIKRFDDKPYMTIGIIVVNIIVFVLMSLSGSTLDAQYMAAHGAMYPEYIKDGQYWRLLTSMFMHFGLMHILNNMVVLGAVGQIVEKAMGHVKSAQSPPPPAFLPPFSVAPRLWHFEYQRYCNCHLWFSRICHMLYVSLQHHCDQASLAYTPSNARMYCKWSSSVPGML